MAHWDFHSDVGSFAPARDGSFVVALRDGIWRFDPASDARSQLAVAPYDMTEERFNDGKCDPVGRFWVGSIDEPRRPGRGRPLVLSRRPFSSGASRGSRSATAWPGAPTRARCTGPTPTAHTVWAFDFEPLSGAMSRPARVRAVRAEAGEWAGRLRRPARRRRGRRRRLLLGRDVRRRSACCGSRPPASCSPRCALPARCPTMPCFGGDDLKTVYVTSASLGRPPEERDRVPACGLHLRVPGRRARPAGPLHGAP